MNEIVKLESRQSTLLGTAAWYAGGGAIVRPYQKGDIWIGRTANGEACGCQDDRHAFGCAGTRGGKGISLVIPNIVLWPGSTLVVDPKGENAIVTARVRGNGSPYTAGWGQKVHILDPFDEIKTPHDSFADIKACFNPLDMLSVDNDESVDDAGRIAEAIGLSDGNSDPFFEVTGQTLDKAVILHVVSSPDIPPQERNLVTVRKLIVSGDMKARKLAEASGKKKIPTAHEFLFMAMRSNSAFDGVVANYGAFFLDMCQKADRTFMGVLSSAALHTEFIESPGMRRCLASSSFRLSDLKTDLMGVSIYLCLPERYRETHFRWLRMMVALTLAEMERVRQKPASGFPVLMMLDEFPALRRMRSIENAAAQIAGFGVKLFFIVQTLSQLRDIYKDNWETLIANAGCKIFFHNDDHFTRKYVSDLIGDTEVVKTVRSYSQSEGQSGSSSDSVSVGRSVTIGERGFGTPTVSITDSTSKSWSVSRGSNTSQTSGVSETIQRRALVTPDEVGRLFGNPENPTALGLVSGYQPIYLHRPFYFRDKAFRGWHDLYPGHPPPLLPAEIVAVEQRERAEEIALAKASADRLARQQAEAKRQAAEARARLFEEEKRIARHAQWQEKCERRQRRLAALKEFGEFVLYLGGIAVCAYIFYRIFFLRPR